MIRLAYMPRARLTVLTLAIAAFAAATAWMIATPRHQPETWGPAGTTPPVTTDVPRSIP